MGRKKHVTIAAVPSSGNGLLSTGYAGAGVSGSALGADGMGYVDASGGYGKPLATPLAPFGGNSG